MFADKSTLFRAVQKIIFLRNRFSPATSSQLFPFLLPTEQAATCPRQVPKRPQSIEAHRPQLRRRFTLPTFATRTLPTVWRTVATATRML
ncbi:MAG: hypothetical protein SPJ97_06645 [Bacteroides sp.]|nr:hypothetical protein [Bacteroides sp.]